MVAHPSGDEMFSLQELNACFSLVMDAAETNSIYIPDASRALFLQSGFHLRRGRNFHGANFKKMCVRFDV